MNYFKPKFAEVIVNFESFLRLRKINASLFAVIVSTKKFISFKTTKWSELSVLSIRVISL